MDPKDIKMQRPPKPKMDMKALGRVMGYIFKNYKFRMLLVLAFIVLSTISSVAGNLYLETLIDEHIIPLVGAENPVFTGLIKAVGTMAIIYLVGVISSLIHTRVMVTISEGTLKDIRDEMFIKMQKLPIRYFDTNTHGDIMSRYTNDIDTLSQMIAQSIPQFFSSAITIITVFVSPFQSTLSPKDSERNLTGTSVLPSFEYAPMPISSKFSLPQLHSNAP